MTSCLFQPGELQVEYFRALLLERPLFARVAGVREASTSSEKEQAGAPNNIMAGSSAQAEES